MQSSCSVISRLIPVVKLTLKELSCKVATLIAIVLGQRCQAIHNLSLSSVTMMTNKCVFGINTLIKQSKKGKHVALIELMSYENNPYLYVVSTPKEYFPRTKDVRDTDQLFIS